MKQAICEKCRKSVALSDSFCGHCGSKFLNDTKRLNDNSNLEDELITEEIVERLEELWDADESLPADGTDTYKAVNPKFQGALTALRRIHEGTALYREEDPDLAEHAFDFRVWVNDKDSLYLRGVSYDAYGGLGILVVESADPNQLILQAAGDKPFYGDIVVVSESDLEQTTYDYIEENVEEFIEGF